MPRSQASSVTSTAPPGPGLAYALFTTMCSLPHSSTARSIVERTPSSVATSAANGSATAAPRIVCDLAGCGVCMDVHDEHARAFFGESPRRGAANTHCAARNNRDLVR